MSTSSLFRFRTSRPPVLGMHSAVTRWLVFGSAHVGIPAAFGCLTAISTFPAFVFFPLVWLSMFVPLAVRRFATPDCVPIVLVVVIQFAVIAVTLTAAHYAPVKTADHVLSQSLSLPQQTMTLRELIELSDLNYRLKVPVRWLLAMAESGLETPISFPSRHMTLEQFIATVEQQSPLRHSFIDVDRRYTLLWGIGEPLELQFVDR